VHLPNCFFWKIIFWTNFILAILAILAIFENGLDQ
jgi:hypothetical protein